jgi:hypothetical protein
MINSEQFDNQQQLEDLAWALEASAGEFKLILVKCNYLNLQTQLIEELQKICSVEIQILQLQTSERTLYNAIREEFNDQIQALMIVGWESLPNLSQMLSSANQVREEFRSNCCYPVVHGLMIKFIWFAGVYWCGLVKTIKKYIFGE